MNLLEPPRVIRPRTVGPALLDAVVFDFHGTLVDGSGFTKEIALTTLVSALRAAGVDVDRELFGEAHRVEVKRYFDTEVSAGREQHNTVWIARALSSLGVPSRPDDAPVRAAVDAYFERFTRELRSFRGCLELFEALSTRYRLGVLSNFTDPRPVHAVLSREGLASHLAAVVISADHGVRKPRPEIFERTLDELGVEAERTLFVGDDPVDDIDAAASLGWKTAWIRRPVDLQLPSWVEPPPRPVPSTQDVEVDTVADLLPLLT